MKVCEFCGYNDVAESKWSVTCDGVQYMQVDPYAQEIYGDEEEVFMCDGAAHDSAMDI